MYQGLNWCFKKNPLSLWLKHTSVLIVCLKAICKTLPELGSNLTLQMLLCWDYQSNRHRHCFPTASAFVEKENPWRFVNWARDLWKDTSGSNWEAGDTAQWRGPWWGWRGHRFDHHTKRNVKPAEKQLRSVIMLTQESTAPNQGLIQELRFFDLQTSLSYLQQNIIIAVLFASCPKDGFMPSPVDSLLDV